MPQPDSGGGFNLPLLFNHPKGLRNPFHGLPINYAMEVGDLTGYQGFATDFARWDGPIAEGTDAGIILTGVTGVATVTRIAVRNFTGIRLNTEAILDANATLEWPMQFGYSSVRKLWVAARIRISDVNDIDVHFGLGTPGTPDWVNALPVEGLFFAVDELDATGAVNFVRRDASVSTVQHTAMTTLADNTFIILGFIVDELGYLRPFYGADIHNLTFGTASASTTNMPDDSTDELSLYLNVETGNSEADWVDLDWVVCAAERS